MNKSFIIPAVLASLVLISSCSKKLSISDVAVGNKFEVNNFNFEYLDSRARIKFDDGRKRMALNATIRIKKDSVIWISLSPMLGIEVARGLITRDSLALMDRINQEYKVYDYISLSKEFNFPIDFHLIQSFLLGNMPWEADLDDRLRKNKGNYLLKQQIGPIFVENHISPKTMKVEKVSMQEGPTQNTLTFQYGDFQALEKKIFPYSSDILLTYSRFSNQYNTTINIDHSKVEIDGGKELSFPFNVPDKYARKW